MTFLDVYKKKKKKKKKKKERKRLERFFGKYEKCLHVMIEGIYYW